MRISEILGKYVLCCGLVLAAVVPFGDAHADSVHQLYAFKRPPDGSYPVAGVIMDGAGNLYGTTERGGSLNCSYGCGIVFEVAPDGAETVLHAFTGGNDGNNSFAGLIQDKMGNLYGTTSGGGGGGAGCGSGGCGTVFKLAADGTDTVLYSFSRKFWGHGWLPLAGLIADEKGNLFGTTAQGGSGDCTDGCGVVFKLAPDGTERVLHNFVGGNDGYYPAAGLIVRAGNFYSTTRFGGGGSCTDGGDGCGTVFELAADGTETVLYSFTGGSDGARPMAGLIADEKGNLFGTTEFGGGGTCEYGCGTVFKLAPDGTETVLHTFAGGNDGAYPMAGLILDDRGNLYGTTAYGGGRSFCNYGCGTVFKLKPDGAETVLRMFNGRLSGESPQAGLIMDSKGNLYGTAAEGRRSGHHGSVFRLGK